jgi:DNA polymerase I
VNDARVHLTRLGFRHVWAIDFEFVAHPGHKPIPVCMVARCFLAGTSIRLWGHDLAHSPFNGGDDELFVAFYASAEASCFDALVWPRPRQMLDLFAEFRRLTNGAGNNHGNGLIGALLHFGLPTIGAEEKAAMRDLVMRGGPSTDDERTQILDYCESDVDAVLRLLPAVLVAADYTDADFGRALLRGRYMAAAGAVENFGIPIDTALLNRLTHHWGSIKHQLIRAIDADYDIYDGSHFVTARFEQYLVRKGIAWPRLMSGALCLNEDAFRQQARQHPEIAPLHELRYTLGQLRLNELAVGPDSRNRVLLSAFRARTSRNQPSNSRFIFGPATWLRSLIQPPEGRAIAYVDWSAQEIAIAGALSGDARLWDAYAGGDPYIAFAQQAGLVPQDATKASHPRERQACKAMVLGTGYGMSADSIAQQAGIHIEEARSLLQLHRELYWVFWTWAEDNVNRALLGMPLQTTFGWRLHYAPGCGVPINTRSILNWPMQANGAEMMRLGVSMAVEAGLMVCAPVHDALLLEASVEEIDAQAEHLAQIMGDASELVLGPGKRCRSDIKVVRYPDRFEDERGVVMFQKVMALLEAAERSHSMMADTHAPKWEGAIPQNGWVPHPRLGACMEPMSNIINVPINNRGNHA